MNYIIGSTCSKTRLTENVFPLTPTLTRTLTLTLTLTLTITHNNVFELTKYDIFVKRYLNYLKICLQKMNSFVWFKIY